MYAIFDTETNGLPKGDDFSDVYMTQIALIITDGKVNFEEIEILIKGDYYISQEITKLTGITKELVDKKGIKFSLAWGLINDLLEKYNVKYIIAHNNRFDNKVINQEYRRLYNIKNKEIPNNKNQEENDKLIFNIRKMNIFSSNFMNKIKYNIKILRSLYNFLLLNNNKSLQDIYEYVFDIYSSIKKQNKIFGERFFQCIPIDSLNDIFKKVIIIPTMNDIKMKLKNKNIKGINKLKKNELFQLYYDIFNIKKMYIENYKLETIYNYLHDEPYIQKHTALDDCWILQKSLEKINFKIIDFI